MHVLQLRLDEPSWELKLEEKNRIIDFDFDYKLIRECL